MSQVFQEIQRRPHLGYSRSPHGVYQEPPYVRFKGKAFPLYLFNLYNKSSFSLEEVDVSPVSQPDPEYPGIVDVTITIKATQEHYTVRYNRIAVFALSGYYFSIEGQLLREPDVLRYEQFSTTTELVRFLNSKLGRSLIELDEIIDTPIRWDDETPGSIRIEAKPNGYRYYAYYEYPLVQPGGLPETLVQSVEAAVETIPDTQWFLQSDRDTRIVDVLKNRLGPSNLPTIKVQWTVANVSTDYYTTTYQLEWSYQHNRYRADEQTHHTTLTLRKYNLSAMQTEYLTYQGRFPLTLGRVVEWLASQNVIFEETDIAGFFLSSGRHLDQIEPMVNTVVKENVLSFKTPIEVQLESEATTLVLVMSDRSERFMRGSYYILELR